MTALLALNQGGIFIFGTVVFIAVFTAALSLAYLKFDEWGEEDEPRRRYVPEAELDEARPASNIGVGVLDA